MKRSSKIALGITATPGLGLALAASFIHLGPMRPGMMRHGMQGGPMAGQVHSRRIA